MQAPTEQNGSSQDAPRFSLIDSGHYAVACSASASNDLALAQHASRDLYIHKSALGPLPAMIHHNQPAPWMSALSL